MLKRLGLRIADRSRMISLALLISIPLMVAGLWFVDRTWRNRQSDKEPAAVESGHELAPEARGAKDPAGDESNRLRLDENDAEPTTSADAGLALDPFDAAPE